MNKNRDGYKETAVGWIPEDWGVTRICDVAPFISNGFVGTASPFYSEDESSTLYLMGNNVRENYIDKRTLVRINNEFTEKNPKSKVFEGDMLTVQSGHIGTSCVVNREFDKAHCHAVIITRFDRKQINPHYQAYYLNSSKGKIRLRGLFVGTTIKHINTKDLKVFEIPLPPIKEQKRIAEILSTTDNHIEKLDMIIKDYQLLKKGMMQKLLT
jgi:type I restriction enzyme S subunit